MGFFFNEAAGMAHQRRAAEIMRDCKRELRRLKKHKGTKPKHGRRLLMRSRRFRRLQMLKQFEVGRVYTVVKIRELDHVPDELLLWDFDEAPEQEAVYASA